ncbi:MAG: YciI family protein [Patescibacteria group bacterium]|jgi:hypothetical protein
MQFLVIGKDGKDKNAMKRRMSSREAHIKFGDEMEALGNRWYGCVMLDDNSKMIGSMAVMDFPTEREFKKWLKKEPYVTGKAWKKIEVFKCNVKRPWKFNRPESFFENRNKV